MNRICEEVQFLGVFAPQEVATATEKTSAFVDASGADVVEFLIYTGALSSGKKLTVGIHTSAEASGGSPEKVGDAEFTVSGAEPGLAVVSYRVQGGRGRYVGVSFQHDADAGVDCAVVAVVRPAYRPPEDGWKLVV